VLISVGNFYTPVKQLIANGVRAGFISAKNAQLVQIVDLGDEEANDSEERAAEWGPLAVKALKEWTFPVSTMSAQTRLPASS
jgi:phage gp45-like